MSFKFILPALFALLATPSMTAAGQSPHDDFGGATALNRAEWFKAEDYPESALYNERQGTVYVAFDILPDGRASGCTVARTSGHADLDRHACRLIQNRARFRPATDTAGNAVPAKGKTRFVYALS
ncbi:energy transducer TonB [Sphingomonas sp. AX6]|uniref:energy transducer TonB n=1 Tax=Sphingomonas sp. AX6 TaxID=2653171 RepID=UPI0012EF2B70|nr:energy transducer TonB [Sphingomonas sp. AX6]VXC54180.1 TonB family protein [Sphingomonas sp. AX6]